ncbi:MAG TPA: DUF72 domain-containing protein [Bacteroidales bacterium]|nr:DUF72 domain-containing protein [Bacteroidales bacterium]HPP92492.1 DUF72 domain-containing protein [Bacteroidales bacterium]
MPFAGENTPGSVHIGTSGWSYAHWAGLFYPGDIKPAKYLEYYTTRFSCVELNSSFYHLPSESTVKGWLNRTPASFIFCPKFSRYVTHELHLMNADEATERFFEVFSELKPKLGPVLIQLPPSLKYDEPLVSTFLGILKEKYSSFRFAVEIRNKSFLSDKFFNLLNSYNMAFVIADSGNRYPYSEVVTAGFIYIRFHGRENLYASDYNDDILREYAEKIKKWNHEGKEVWVFFNNDFHGYAVKNALSLMKMLNS